ncbi:helix-turn-helix domain-containing protein [Jiella mangrovi]|uniref:Helix-turn-helix transcriptional regulator n=1 Tax=Jiella mangrovi TaxID=2821407 RepID=A0ABS4BKL0_9HYPH|nr:helix-turn-helix transcriptional regulator [Jiella mangrovi]MBP0616699.1 helix-turn-helix transcriptional regulator [Jiella mangrovi]
MATAFGKRLAKAREKAGLTASDLARETNVSPTAVWNWEKNGSVPRDDKIPAIAKAVGVSVEFLRTGRPPENLSPPPRTRRAKTVADVITEAQNEISQITGIAIDRVKLRVEFESE